ncbi:transposase [Serratia liquefaciens]|uniref:transposase n=1 Tax=Serratia liquefaciens TaxID=614 RepID=UPI002183676F|nr:transposase [Serratia liquefaciens]CAI2540244.1 Transposase and inactivated derivatives [Serratia liquefaciens]
MTHYPSRKSFRLRYYNYASAGIYFVTICTHKRQCLFGTINNSVMQMSTYGKVAEECWLQIPQHFNGAHLDSFVLMPNHLHALLHLRNEKAVSLGTIIRSFKSAVTRQLHQSVWQRSYWEGVIRSERELALTQEYIANNPAQWGTDKGEDY